MKDNDNISLLFDKKVGKFPDLHRKVRILNLMGAFDDKRKEPITMDALAELLYEGFHTKAKEPIKEGFNRTRLENVLYGRKSISEHEAMFFFNAFLRVFELRPENLSPTILLDTRFEELLKSIIHKNEK